ncbi:MAG TPA: restriction endonuclease [Aestuariivirga sp.]|nr:restriction endonuclease [Aestuariivirga sp.]
MTVDYSELMKPWYEQMAAEKPSAQPIPNRLSEAEEYEVADAHTRATHVLRLALLGRILAQSPEFFEQLIIDVMLAMGDGARRRDLARRLGRKGDGGVDGIVEQDELGLDVIYLQAKRYKLGSPVAVADVRDFAGTLDAHHADKGVFVATSQFTKAARDFVSLLSRRIVLIDGQKLTGLMIRHNIGVKVQETFQFKRLDADYFSPTSFKSRTADMISASSQPRTKLSED